MISLLGYGRFGAALGTLLQEAGHRVRALDPAWPEGAGAERATSIAELVAGARFVIVAVPVPATRPALETLAPHLAPEQVVLDVGSVKCAPCADMDAVLGERVGWAGTHPLFGPMSLARGERPLTVVLCPAPRHPRAAGEVRALFSGLGCQVVELDAAEHDRRMAYTHSLAFFLAKGLLDAGAPTGDPLAPPSYQAIARTIEAVRADAAHLFTALHRHNPFAAEARQRLLAALQQADRHLAGREAPPPAADPLTIPDLGAHSPALRQAREQIDDVDREILALLGRRAQLARRAGQAKAELGRGVRDPGREARLLQERAAWAAEAGLDQGGVQAIFEAVLRFSRRVQGEGEA